MEPGSHAQFTGGNTVKTFSHKVLQFPVKGAYTSNFEISTHMIQKCRVAVVHQFVR